VTSVDIVKVIEAILAQPFGIESVHFFWLFGVEKS